MPKVAKPLTARQVETAKPGMHADGRGLYLAVGENSKSWLFRYKLGDRRREMGLGPYPVIGLQAARDAAIDLQRKLRTGADPIDEKRAAKAPVRRIPTFKECAEAYLTIHQKDCKNTREWPESLNLYVYPIIGADRVDRVDDDRVLAVLEPIWTTVPTTASRVRGRIEAVLEYARSKKYRPEGLNPARWDGHMKNLLGNNVKSKTHHDALPWQDAPAFVAELANDQGIPAVAALFAILTATRASETAGATWDEIDMAKRLWTIPPERMKVDSEHVVPLSEPAMAILRRLQPFRSNSDNRVFLPRGSGTMRSQAMLKAIMRVKKGITLHGFRSTFRQWCADNRKDRDLAEEALAHAVGNSVERSYQRSRLIELRRALMEEWAKHCA